jgi:hypothetical protein
MSVGQVAGIGLLIIIAILFWGLFRDPPLELDKEERDENEQIPP